MTEDTVSNWLASLQLAPATRAEHRTHLLTVWRQAARRGFCRFPGEVRREPIPEPMPRAWTVDEVRELLRACGDLGQTEGSWFRGLIQTCYESGIRRGDAFRLERPQISEAGVIQIRQRKTGRPHVAAIQPETARLVLSLPGARPLSPPWGMKKYGKLWARLRHLAGLPSGACQQLRRTGASWVAAEHGIDAAREFLGHRSGEMWRHYVDQSVAGRKPYLPPRVG